MKKRGVGKEFSIPQAEVKGKGGGTRSSVRGEFGNVKKNWIKQFLSGGYAMVKPPQQGAEREEEKSGRAKRRFT